MAQRSKTEPSHVAVVADQSDDGSFELRVERQPGDVSGRRERISSGPAAVVDTEAPTERVAAGTKPASNKLPLVAGTAVGVGVLLWVIVSMVAPSGPPDVPEPEPVQTFRAYAIEPRPVVQTISASVLAVDAGLATDDAGSDAGTVAVEAVNDEPDLGNIALPDLGAIAPEPVRVDARALRRLENVRVSPNALVVPSVQLVEAVEEDDEFYEDDELYADEELYDENGELYEDDEFYEDEFDDEFYEDEFEE